MRIHPTLFWAALLGCAVLPVTSRSQGTYLYNYEPPAGFTGYTSVYIIGTGFGDTQGTGTITIGGVEVPAAQITMWSQGMLIATVPPGATTGPIVVTTSYGSDSSTAEADPDTSFQGWGGTAGFSANFTVLDPDQPVFPSFLEYPQPCGCSYVGGTWYFDDGWGNTATYTLSQNSTANSDGTWSVPGGNVYWSYYYGEDGTCIQPLTGTLDQNGNLELSVAADTADGCDAYNVAFKILNSGCDRTSPAYMYFPPWDSWPPPSNYLSDLGWYTDGEVLIKGATDLPDTESVYSFDGWVTSPFPDSGPGMTLGNWTQSVSLASNSNLTFGGRLVYEQNTGMVNDTCYFPEAIAPGTFPGVSGGAWWVSLTSTWTTSTWGEDLFGLPSIYVDDYQHHDYGTTPGAPLCTISVPQAMYVDSSITLPQEYVTNTLQYLIYSDQVCEIRIPEQNSENEVLACASYFNEE
jgi:hypothetical protein